MTQEEAARRLGRPQSFIVKCELGHRPVRALELEDFARLYGQPIGYFIEDPSHGCVCGARRALQPGRRRP
jgi:hypothetical protein